MSGGPLWKGLCMGETGGVYGCGGTFVCEVWGCPLTAVASTSLERKTHPLGELALGAGRHVLAEGRSGCVYAGVAPQPGGKVSGRSVESKP